MLTPFLTIVMIILFYFKTLSFSYNDGPTNCSSYLYSFSEQKKEKMHKFSKNAPQNNLFFNIC